MQGAYLFQLVIQVGEKLAEFINSNTKLVPSPLHVCNEKSGFDKSFDHATKL